MQQSVFPHFYITHTINAEPLVSVIEQLKHNQITVTVNDFIIRATALALRQHPDINCGFNSVNQSIIQFKTIDIAIAVGVEGGLITPIIRHADYKSIGELSVEVHLLIQKAQEGKLNPLEYKGGSFTITNLGMFGVKEFQAILNPPQAAILAVSGIQEVPVIFNGHVVPGKTMNLTLSVDHRVIDGVASAQFLQTLKNLLEKPELLGFRIDLGKIESALDQLDSIRKSIVLEREDEPYHKRLVAYLVPHDSKTRPSTSDLMVYLKNNLHDYMIPTLFVFLNKLPLTSSGKVDYKALPAPDISELIKKYVAPSTEEEKKLAKIWSDILHIDHIGIEDHFFELGGQSLLATQVISRIRSEIGVQVSLREFFEKPILAELARLIEAMEQSALDHTIPIVPRDTPLPLSFPQQRYWITNQLEPESSAYNLSNGMRLKGDLNLEALNAAVKGLIQRQESLRTTFIKEEGVGFQKIASHLEIEIPMTDLSDLEREEQSKQTNIWIKEQIHRLFNLSQGPLIRIQLLKLAPQEHILLFTFHHIISDIWSARIIGQELSTFYNAFINQEEVKLPELSIQYADFAVWQREYFKKGGEAFERQWNYWSKKLEGVPLLPTLPTDYPRPLVQSHKGAMLQLTLPQELTQQLRQLAKRKQVTLFTVLLSSFFVFLSRYSEQKDILVNSIVANRNQKEIEGIVGSFANILVLRADLSKDPSFEDFLEQVHEMTLDAHDHQDFPFEKLVEELKQKRSLSYNPLRQVAINWHSDLKLNLEMNGIESQPEHYYHNFTQTDLYLIIKETKEGLINQFCYCTDLFKAETIEGWIKNWVVLVNGIVDQSQAKVSELPMFTEAEQEQIVAKNGKVDRQALPAAPDMSALTKKYVAPRTELEKKIARIWSELLHIDRIGIEDDFFKLGGHSLLTVVLMEKIESELHYKLPLSYFFAYSTIASLAQMINLNDSNVNGSKQQFGLL